MEMVGMMAGNTREQVLSLLNSSNNHPEMGLRIDSIKQLKDILLHRDPSMLKEFMTNLPELQNASFSLVRKYLAKMIEEIGLKNLEHLSQMVLVLLAFLKDDTLAVIRQSITNGTNLFRNALEHVSLQLWRTFEFDRQESASSWLPSLNILLNHTAMYVEVKYNY